jgi:hypothetical protein
VRTKFLQFINQAPCLNFKKLIVTTPTLLQGLHQMSLLKFPEGLKPRECKRIKLCEPLPVPYVPRKDKVQDEVAKLINLKIKTTIEKDIMLNFLVWHKNRTCKAFLMRVTAVLNAIKKRGHFNDYKKAATDHKEPKKALIQPGLLYPCSMEPEQRLRGHAKRRPRKRRRMQLQRSKTSTQMPKKPRMLLKQMTR